MSKLAQELRDRNIGLAIETMSAIEAAICDARANGTIEQPRDPEQAIAQTECVVRLYCELEHSHNPA